MLVLGARCLHVVCAASDSLSCVCGIFDFLKIVSTLHSKALGITGPNIESILDYSACRPADPAEHINLLQLKVCENLPVYTSVNTACDVSGVYL